MSIDRIIACVIQILLNNGHRSPLIISWKLKGLPHPLSCAFSSQSQFLERAVCYGSLPCLSGPEWIRHLPICILQRSLSASSPLCMEIRLQNWQLDFDCTLARGSIYTWLIGGQEEILPFTKWVFIQPFPWMCHSQGWTWEAGDISGA